MNRFGKKINILTSLGGFCRGESQMRSDKVCQGFLLAERGRVRCEKVVSTGNVAGSVGGGNKLPNEKRLFPRQIGFRVV